MMSTNVGLSSRVELLRCTYWLLSLTHSQLSVDDKKSRQISVFSAKPKHISARLIITSHYSKSQILSKNSSLKKNSTIFFFSFLDKSKLSTTANPQHFHEFLTQIFLTIFLVKSKLSTAKKSKPTTFSRVFNPNFFDNFSREIKVVNS